MRIKLLVALVIGCLMFGMVGMVSADTYDQLVTPVELNGDLLMGTGIENGGFTVDTFRLLELGLRGRLRFDSNNLPTNIVNSNGDGTYTFNTGSPTGGAGWVSSTTPLWSFDWSIYNGGNAEINTYTYLMGLDFDPTMGTNFLTFNPTAEPNDNEGMPYAAQNSWNYEFFNDAPFAGFDPNQDGTYNIYLAAFLDNAEVARTDIQIIVGQGGSPVPEPTTMALFGLGLLGVAGVSRRRK